MLLTHKPLAKDIDKLSKGHGKFVEYVVEVPLQESSSSEEASNQEEDDNDDNKYNNDNEYEYEHEDEDEHKDEDDHEDGDHEAEEQVLQGRGNHCPTVSRRRFCSTSFLGHMMVFYSKELYV